MSKSQFATNLSRGFHKAGFKLKKHSPEILVVAGVVGTITSAVLACRATVKVLPVIDKAKKDVATLQETIDNPETLPENVTVEDCKTDVRTVCVKAGVDIAKTYAPSVILGALSVTSILVGHNILHKRNLAVMAAYTAVDSSFKQYRGRVVERFGKELDRELKYNIKAKEVEETVVNEDGTETVEKKVVYEADESLFPKYSEYAVIYDDGCKGWTKDPESNKFFLIQVQNWANEKLRAQGWLYLNDVYDALGFPPTKAGSAVGWVWNSEYSDNAIDFGLWDISNPQKREFVNGRGERNVVIDFNVDGVVHDLMK